MFYTCAICDHEYELEIEATPPIPAQISGPPESCYPAEGGEFDIISGDKCPKCNTETDVEKAAESFWEKLEAQRYDDYDIADPNPD